MPFNTVYFLSEITWVTVFQKRFCKILIGGHNLLLGGTEIL